VKKEGFEMKLRNQFLLYLTPEVKEELIQTAEIMQNELNKNVSASDVINDAVKMYYDNFMSMPVAFRDEMSEKGAQDHKVTFKIFLDNDLRKRLKDDARKYCKMSHIIEYAVIEYLDDRLDYYDYANMLMEEDQ
jgi:hypothetical protein